MKNTTYDKLKWVAILGLPALATAVRMIVALMLGTWLGVSHIQYKNAQKEKGSIVEEIKDDGK